MNNARTKYTLQELIPEGRNLTISIAAAILAYYSPENFENVEEYSYLKSNVESSCTASLPTARSLPSIPTDKRFNELSTRKQLGKYDTVKLFSDYSMIHELFTLMSKDSDPSQEAHWYFDLVETKEDADFLFQTQHVTDFLGIPTHQRISQFPYEGGFVRKDLLPLTVRKYCYNDEMAPFWWLHCFDISTEFHLFSHYVNSRFESNQSNAWIIKPSQGTRALGHFIAIQEQNDTDVSTLLETVASSIINECGDRVAQLLVTKPLLLYGRKFDLRIFILMKSFEPFEGYFHEWYYARIANKEYNDQPEILKDEEVFLTVNCYHEDEDIANKQERLDSERLKSYFATVRPEISWDLLESRIKRMFYELFHGMRHSVGEWPNSSAYYSVDVILEEQQNGTNIDIIPRLLEINFMGDWHGPLLAFGEDRYKVWASDVLNCLCRDDYHSPRLVPLVPDSTTATEL